MDIFETASRRKYRFTSAVGDLTTEQLWDLPLVATGNKLCLDAIAQTANRDLKAIGEESFVQLKPDPRKADLETKLEVVKHIIGVKIKEQEDARAAMDRADKRRKLLDALAAQEDKALASMSKDEILKQLAELDA